MPLSPVRAMHRIEVILCTFNGESFIGEQLESILCQTKRVDMVSVYDDGSVDDTVTIVESYRELFECEGIAYNVKFNSKNLGYALNFAQGVEKSQCEFLFFCDQDDIWETNKVAVQSKALCASAVDMVFSDGMLVNKSGDVIDARGVLDIYGLPVGGLVSFNKEPIKYFARRNYVNGCASAVRRSALLKAGYPPLGMPHDYWYAIWCALHGGVIVIPDKLYKYRQHDSNVIGIGGGHIIFQLLSIFRAPRGPRLREQKILISVLEGLRFTENPDVFVLKDKYEWMCSILDEKNKFRRFYNICCSLLRGKYHSYGQPYSLIRDLVSCLRS
jgi:glycosyltransferase involved in cell wall biosynthesis